MISTRLLSALAAATTVFSMALADTTTPTPTLLITTPTVIKPASAMIEMGCYETSVPLEDHGPYGFQTPGNCQLVCLSLDKPVMALAEGTNCWCGDKLPPKSAVTDNSTCDTNCKGDDRYKCMYLFSDCVILADVKCRWWTFHVLGRSYRPNWKQNSRL